MWGLGGEGCRLKKNFDSMARGKSIWEIPKIRVM